MGEMGIVPESLNGDYPMTIQVSSTQYSTSKKALQDRLNTEPGTVTFYNPSLFTTLPSNFYGRNIPERSHFPVVMDHPKRNRFATITRKPDGTFKVS